MQRLKILLPIMAMYRHGVNLCFGNGSHLVKESQQAIAQTKFCIVISSTSQLPEFTSYLSRDRT